MESFYYRHVLRCHRCLYATESIDHSLVDDKRFRSYINKLIKEYDTLEASSMQDSLNMQDRNRLIEISPSAKLVSLCNQPDKYILCVWQSW